MPDAPKVSGPNNDHLSGWISFGLVALTWVILITRFGLLAFISGIFVRFLLVSFPITTDLTVWYSDAAVFPLAVVLAVAAYGFYVSLAGQKIFGLPGDVR
jgi:hypothetical protein